MIISVDKFLQHVKTDKPREVLEVELLALESLIRNHTNNNFQNIYIRFVANASNSKLQLSTVLLKVGDTIEISQSKYNNGVYVIKSMENQVIQLDNDLIEEQNLLITKVEYPLDVQMGVIDMMKWKLKNEKQNYDDDAKKEIQSETISRHSVTYAKDTTESDIDEKLGFPKKYCKFMNKYNKARF